MLHGGNRSGRNTVFHQFANPPSDAYLTPTINRNKLAASDSKTGKNMTEKPGFLRLDKDDEKKTEDGAKSPAIDKHLFDARTVLITGQINHELARDTCARLLALAQASNDPILVVVSSPGGHVESGDMIHDMIRFIKPKVNILGTGWVASAGALIFVSVPREQRFATPNTRFLLHQPSGGAGGAASDIEIQAREIIKMRHRLNRIFAEATGQPEEQIAADTDRDHWMSVDEAIKYGLCGRKVKTATEIK